VRRRVTGGDNMVDEASSAEAIAREIGRYLIANPEAADTLEGVALWWLSGNVSEAFLAEVHEAMTRLINAGRATRRTMVDGTVIYEGVFGHRTD
jgi:hypothetical protein